MKIKKTVKMNIPDYWGVGKRSPFKSMTPRQDQFSWTNGKDFSLTRGKEFSWIKNEKIPKKKNMNYKQANQFFSLSPIGDADRDKVPNWRDCRPYDPSMQGKHFDAFKEKVGGVAGKLFKKKAPTTQTTLADFGKTPPVTKAPVKQTKLPVAPAEPVQSNPDWYMFVKFADRKWEQVATLKQNQVKGAVEDFKTNFPNVEYVQVSQNPKLLGQLNRKLAVQHAKVAIQHTKKAVSKYAERQQFKKHIKEGLTPKSQGLAQRRPSSMPNPIMGMRGATPGMIPPSYPRSFGSEGGGSTVQTASPQQTVKINIPQAFGGNQTVGAPSVETSSEEELPEENTPPEIEGVAPEEHLRKIPPGVQRYSPVTREQSTISRPLLRAPYQDQRPTGMSIGGKITGGRMLYPHGNQAPSRPVGVIPIAEFPKSPPVRFMKFGRRVKE